jgi:hypothetical protein
MKHISALMNPWFLILVITGANNIFGENPFDLAISFGVLQLISWFQPYQGKNPNTKLEEYHVGASIVLQFSEAQPVQYHFVFHNFSPVLHFLIISVQWDIRQQVQ